MLIHRWPLTDLTTIYDVVGGLTLTNSGGVTFSRDGGASIDRTTQVLTFTKTPPAKVSLSIWSKISNRVGADTSVTLFGNTRSGVYGITVYMSAVDFFTCCYGTSPTTPVIRASNFDNNWRLYTLTYSGAILTAGCNLEQTSVAASTLDSGTSFGIGGEFGRVMGLIGTHLDARIYDHALSYDEIRQLYIAGPNGAVATCPKGA